MPTRTARASPPRPLALLALAVAAGAAAGESSAGLACLAGAAAVAWAVWAFLRRNLLRAAAILVTAASAMAAWTVVQRHPAPDDIRRIPPGDYVTIVGVVCADVYPHTRSIVCQLRVTSVQRYGARPEAASGRVFAFLSAAPGRRLPDYGDTLFVHGRMEEPRAPTSPGGFDEVAFAQRSGVERTIRTRTPADWGDATSTPGWSDLAPRLAADARRAFMDGLRRVLPTPRSDLVGGIVLGSSSGLPDALKDDFIETGTAHVLAASGYNVAVVALCALPLGRRLGLSRRPASLLALALVAAYVLIAGAKPSVVRAGIMAALFLGAELLDRDADAANLLAASAIVILLADPEAIRDVGFQLSYAIVGVIVIASPILGWCAQAVSAGTRRLQAFAWADRLAAAVAVGAATTALAQLAALPLMAQQFNQAPMTGIFANALMLPLVGALTIAGLALGLIALPAPALAALCAPCVGILATLILGIARAGAELPFASAPVPSPGWPAVGAYLVALVAALTWMRRAVDAAGAAEWQVW